MQLATCPAAAAAPELGAPIFTSSGDVDALMDQLQSSTDALNNDITNWYKANTANQSVAGFADAWVKWRDNAYGAIKHWRDGWKIFNLAWNHFDIAQAKLVQLNEWRQNFAANSGRSPSGPPPKVPDGSIASTIITGAVVLAAVGGIAFVGWKVYMATKAVGSVRAMLSPKAAATAGARRGRFAGGAEPVVKRAPDFRDTGNYDVTTPNGKTHRIYRDPENGWWYVEGPGHYSERCVGFTKKEAVARVVGK